MTELGNFFSTLAHIYGILGSVRVGIRIDPISRIQRWWAEVGNASHSDTKQPIALSKVHSIDAQGTGVPV